MGHYKENIRQAARALGEEDLLPQELVRRFGITHRTANRLRGLSGWDSRRGQGGVQQVGEALKLIRERPDVTTGELIGLFGISRQRVHQLRVKARKTKGQH